MLGKAEGKGKAGCKGKGKCWGKSREKGQDPSPEAETVRTCARPGCPYQVTFHSSHCCAKCAGKGGHGPRCERKEAPQKPNDEQKQGCQEKQQAEHEETRSEVESCAANAFPTLVASAPPETPCPAAPAVSPDYVFPVELDDGRKFQISWCNGDNHEQVAHQFIAEHRLPPDNLETILHFILHAEAVTAVKNKRPREEPPAPAPEPMVVDEAQAPWAEQIQQLRDMGFQPELSDEFLCNLLTDCDGNVQKVLDRLLAQ
mmetsp:Transcript_20347/g.46046  ORF Transcript_20347/g.46046 Transcript_20347/m.46046 type:complete len:258 (-) Transcript_20347:86-859(-)